MDTKLSKVGVIGAGVIGLGVAQTAAQFGRKVVLIDYSQSVIENVPQQLAENIRLQSLLVNRKIHPAAITDNIHVSTDYSLLHEVDFIVENVTEDIIIKKKVYTEIDRICKESCIFGANTSAIMISQIASFTQRQDRVIGIHFMNPVYLKDAAEVILGVHTSHETIETTKRFLGSIRQEAIIVNDSPGFVTNRVFMLTINEAICLVHENVASVEDIDRLFKNCFGHKMGPLETADLIGLDTILNTLGVLFDSFKDNKFRPCPLLLRMVHSGQLGKKNGKGFYRYIN